jgi:hypothetical protein
MPVAGLRLAGPAAPTPTDRAMNGEAFAAYTETLNVSGLAPGDIVIPGNQLARVPAHAQRSGA